MLYRFCHLLFDNQIVLNLHQGYTEGYQELPDGLTETYKIVGSAEANPFEYKISNESPVAQALLGKEVGDVAKVSLPTGPEDSMDIKILAVE